MAQGEGAPEVVDFCTSCQVAGVHAVLAHTELSLKISRWSS